MNDFGSSPEQSGASEGAARTPSEKVELGELTRKYQPRKHLRRTKTPEALTPKKTDYLIKALLFVVVVGVVGLGVYYTYGKYQTQQEAKVVNRYANQAEENVRKNPRNASARIALANIFLNQGRYDEAIEQFNQALKLNKKDQQSIVGLGLCYMKKDDDDKALEYFEKEIELAGKDEYSGINSSLETAYYYAGVTWYKKAHYDKALEYLRKASYMKSGSSDTYLAIGRALLEKKDYKAAVQEFERALNFDPKYADAHYGVGLCYEKLNQKEEALLHFRKALELAQDQGQGFKLAGEAISRLEKK